MSESKRKRPLNFAIIGCGFISDRHQAAIEHIGGKLLMACDIDETKRDKIDSDVEFYTDIDIMMTRVTFRQDVDWVIICTPNNTHVPLSIKMMEAGKNVLCEKPTGLSEEDLKTLSRVEKNTGKKFRTVLQLRESPKIKDIKKQQEMYPKYSDVVLDLQLHRGDFYWEGWKGDLEQSGGLLFNIGVHYFDLVHWIYGNVKSFEVTELNNKFGSGVINFDNAMVNWKLSLEAPKDNQHRIFQIDDYKLNLTRILESLHNTVYERLVDGLGVTVEDAMPVTKLIESMTNSYETGG